MRVSHVGSFPPTSKSIREIFRDMVEVGVGVPPYPQVRSFIEIFLDPLLDLRVLSFKGKNYFLNIRDPRDVKLDVKAPFEAVESVREAERLKVESLRGPVTGPLTLASRVYVGEAKFENSLLSKKEFVFELLKEYVSLNVEKLISLGYTHIFIDEPILSNIVGSKRILFGYSEDEIIQLYNDLTGKFKSVTFGVHICGRIPRRLVGILARVDNLKVFNHEFKGTPENFETIDSRVLEEYDKTLAPGIVSSKECRVESLESTVNLLEKLISKYGFERLDLISGDCGFSSLKPLREGGDAYRSAIGKLRVLREAVELVLRRNVK